MDPVVERTARWAGLTLSDAQRTQLARYRSWLQDEALPAGGIGPAEGDRIDERHLADSLAFAAGWDSPPTRLLDVGSGVGLPGIPLAVALPATEVTVTDRSGRRCSLLRRAARILQLRNVEVRQADIDDVVGRWPVVVARASLGPEEALRRLPNHLESPGVLILGGSRRERPQAEGYQTIEIPSEVLASGGWLLKMALP